MTALRLGVLSSCQWMAALRHSELGVPSSYEQMAIVRHLEWNGKEWNLCCFPIANKVVNNFNLLSTHYQLIRGLGENSWVREKGRTQWKQDGLHLGDLIPHWFRQELVKKPSSSSSKSLCWICVRR
ncbi:uncharacterized protein LOC125536007 [Triticum urartu]|uniref:uncharacterized protein LOC125536007 n=1 Tax=Triticum urartu TaxID=4572 RepID=UPI0020445FEC|nr:uncharacterized protein LOC125536007 [Triticum urartu]